MGSAQGKAVSEQYTIRISRQLLEELDGGAPPPRAAAATRSRERRVAKRDDDIDEPAVKLPAADVRTESDALVQQALQQSMRVGASLLKQEAAEMERITRLAQELLDRESKVDAFARCVSSALESAL